jgi:predicted alpha/beta-hydrolase family hydrolase
MLIIQGNRDEYGGSEAVRNVPLSPGIELFFVDSTHDYRLDSRQWDTVLSKIESTLSPGFRPGDILAVPPG